VLDIEPGGGSSTPTEFTVAGNRTFFSADGPDGRELWKKTVTGAVQVEDIVPGAGGSSPSFLVDVDGTLFFSAFTAADGFELWRSDGFAADTSLVVDILPDSGHGSPTGIVDSGAFGGGILFAADNGTHGNELFSSNGSAGNIQLVSNFEPGAGPSFPRVELVNGLVAFVSAETTATGVEPWISVDTGVTFTEISLGDLNPGPSDSFPGDFVVAGGTTFFVAETSANGRELWKTGGSAATTAMVKDIFPGTAPAQIFGPVAFDGKLFFGACEPATGCELWTSDGTNGGTTLFKDLFPGIRSGDPRYLKVVGDELYFRACDETAGCEVWVSDGTPAKTRRIADLRPGARSSKPGGEGFVDADRRFVPSGAFVYFEANDGSGEELWAVLPPLFFDNFEGGNATLWSLTFP
jgi:ELWxxDGT repeat protein